MFLLSGKTAISALTILVMTSISTVAFADSSSMAVMAASAEMQGTTSFYYSNEWLVKFVQFCISWLCIIALIVYYAGWLCSMVVLSNKELFYLIDTIKKEASETGGEQKGFSGVNAVLHSFKNGSKDGVNGGLDNVVLFFLALSINFKAYSYYKDVEAGSGGDDGGSTGSKFNYNDTMLNFILKTAIQAIAVTFICSVAISGILMQCWFTISDVLIVRAERFANTNLSAKVDQWLGDAGGYNFTLTQATSATIGEDAQAAAKTINAQINGQYPGATKEQRHQIGVAVEEAVKAAMLGSDPVKTTENNLKKYMPDGTAPSLTNESQLQYVSVKVSPTTNQNVVSNDRVVVDMHSIMEAAKVSVADDTGRTPQNIYFQLNYKWDAAKAGNQTKSGKEVKTNKTPIPSTPNTQ